MDLHLRCGWGLSGLLALTVSSLAGAAHAVRVPQDQPTIQAAVDAARDGDRIVVGRGRFCGATLTRRVELQGTHGATIIGCAEPVVGSGLRIGFFLPDGRASGSSIRGFRFDGTGISNQDLTPLALGVLARSADDVRVVENEFIGNVQAVTNTDGSGWWVLFNRIHRLTALTCDGLCTGGDAVVFQQRLELDVRPRGNVAAFNEIQGRIPDGLNEFSMVGVFLLGQDRALVLGNQLALPDNAQAVGEGVGILVTDQCCASVVVSTSIDWRVLFNDGRRSQVAVRVDPDAQGGRGNLEGAILFGNRGPVVVPPPAALRVNRLAPALVTRPPARPTLPPSPIW
jgi:hypothetical protein